MGENGLVVFKGLGAPIQPRNRIPEVPWGYRSQEGRPPTRGNNREGLAARQKKSGLQKPTLDEVFHQVGDPEIPRRGGFAGGDPRFQHAQFGSGDPHHIAFCDSEAEALLVLIPG